MKRTRVFARFAAVCGAIVSVYCCLPGSTAGAFDPYPDWQAGEPVARVNDAPATKNMADTAAQSCTDTNVAINGYGDATVCLTGMAGWRYGIYNHPYYDYGTWSSQPIFVIGIGADTDLYPVDGMPTATKPLSNPGSDILTYFIDDNQIQVYRHFLSYLDRAGDHYRVGSRAPDLLRTRTGDIVELFSAAVSHSGDWLVADTPNGIIRADLATLEVRTVSPLTTDKLVRTTPAFDLAVNDDGQIIAVGGRLYGARELALITVKDGCGAGASQSACPIREAQRLFDDGSLPDGWPVGLTLSTHGRRLDFFIDGYDGRYRQASLYPYGSAPATLRYLALGDSFSSGEGDPGRYLAHTDVGAAGGLPAERCHVSDRSYPFLLAAYGGLNAFSGPLNYPVESVACNNAYIDDIAGNSAISYLGQDGRLAGLSTAVLDDLRTAAIDQFIPGRLRQADFVEAYRPRAVTIGIGGNDVQFAGVLNDCARSIVTCSYAADPTDRRTVGESIKALYPKLTALYAALAKADPAARIYAVGYPRFINETDSACPLTTNLDYAERQMIDQGVRYLNQVVKAAAASAGAGYLDVQDALVGHRLCDGPAEYVNGLTLKNLQRPVQETFHPNALGQQAIALAIERQLGTGDLAGTNYCLSNQYPCPNVTDPPGLPTFFGDESVRPIYVAVPSELIVVPNATLTAIMTRGVAYAVQTGQLARASLARIELHSDPTTLATVAVGSDGVLNTPVTIPNSVPAGYHTLHLYGTSPSGEAVDLYQIVYITDPASGATDTTAPALPVGKGNNSADIIQNAGAACMTQCGHTKPPAGFFIQTATVLPDTTGQYGPVLVGGLLAMGFGIVVAGRRLWRRRQP